VRNSRFFARSCSAAVLAAAFSPCAAGEVHGYVTAGTDYVFRGISQSNEEPSLQAGLDCAHAGGFFVGLFAALIDYPAIPMRPDTGDVELDVYAGFSRPAGRDFAWDVALIHYQFPESEAEDDDYQELGFNLHYRDAARLGFTVADDARTRDATAWTAELELRRPLGERLQLSGTLGHYAFGGGDWRDYLYWDFGVSATAGSLTFDLRYFDTSSEAETVAGPDLTAGRVVVSASIGF
jgi:uncharacterized protein (TIGR02001 family)